jgi:F0F1-type ATP synthase assembly protein I
LRGAPINRYNFAFPYCCRARNDRDRVTSPLKSRPFRTVFQWQAIATLAIAAVAGGWAGWNGAWSAMLGGAVSLAAGAVFGGILGLTLGDGRPAGPIRPLRAMFRAEAAKVIAIVAGLWLVLTNYGAIVHAAFFGAFVVAVIVFSMAFFVSDEQPGKEGDG